MRAASRPSSTNQASSAKPITGPRRSGISASRRPSDSTAPGRRRPRRGSAWPDISAGTAIPQPIEDRRGDVGARARSRRGGCCPRSGCRRSRGRRCPIDSASFSAGGGFSIAISRSLPRRASATRDESAAQAPTSNFEGRGRGPGGGLHLTFSVERALAGRDWRRRKSTRRSDPHPDPDSGELRGSRSGGPGRFRRERNRRGRPLRSKPSSPRPSGGKLRVVERVEDPVALPDVEVRLLARGQSPSPR